MARKSFSTRERTRIFKLHGGICHLCKQEIQIGEAFDLEHVIPWELTRDDSDENVKPAHKHCHKEKTKEDVRAIRKADRIHAKFIGTYPKSKTPIRSRGFQKREW